VTDGARPDAPDPAGRPDADEALRSLLLTAADRSRTSMRERFGRMTAGWRSVIQLAVAVVVSWLVARHVLGHEQPFFAPVAAIITLGVTMGQRHVRAVELAIGVVLGILIGDLAVHFLGRGPLQMGVIVAVATCAALLLGSGQLLTNQAAISAIFVVALEPAGEGFSLARALDALVGGAVGLAAHAAVVPAHPLSMVRNAAAPVFDELAAVLCDIAEAIRRRDRDVTEAALARARATDALSTRLTDTIDVARQVPLGQRRARDSLDAYAQAAAHIDLAIRNVRVLARGMLRALILEENVPPGVAAALDDLAVAVRALPEAVESDARRGPAVAEPALRAAARASLVLEQTSNLSVSVIIGQVRSTVVDLLRAVGWRWEDAAAAVRDAAATVDVEP
jgi:uncharacterized membrane protein YgaE (UPF0421/DUF939 family)